jgi:hypothetical protein
MRLSDYAALNLDRSKAAHEWLEPFGPHAHLKAATLDVAHDTPQLVRHLDVEFGQV